MAIVINKLLTGSLPVGTGTIQIIYNVDAADYSTDEWLINPDLSSVENYHINYWKIVNEIIVLMTDSEQNGVNIYLESSYSPNFVGFVESAIQSGTTSTNGQIKLILESEFFAGKKYKIDWYCELGSSKNNKTVGCKLFLNNTKIAENYKLIINNDNFESFHGFYYSNNLNGVNSFCMKYYNDNTLLGLGSVYIKNAKILITII